MNDRFIKIAQQASADLDPEEFMGASEVFLEKYAELIVKECAEVGYDSVENGDDIDDIMRRVHNNILKHFGVEE